MRDELPDKTEQKNLLGGLVLLKSYASEYINKAIAGNFARHAVIGPG